ncbi:MAG: PfaD family polyunsaturated fatty acid/polyketide biosynthesis protein [Anaerolineaceae bacterium]|nr:PfaD family polyunsaturated fatty acid/polyketide biosynthesis protein [Anaerolineaceae bacterium]
MNKRLGTVSTTRLDTNLFSFSWGGQTHDLAFDRDSLRRCLLQFNLPVYAVRENQKIGFTNTGNSIPVNEKTSNLVGWLPPVSFSQFGDPSFCSTYRVKAAYYTGGMANAIASEEMVITLAKSGLMSSFGSGGLSIERLQKAVDTIQSAIPDYPYIFNLLHNPFEPEVEQQTVEIYLKNHIQTVEAAAYIQLTPALVQYRASGLSRDSAGNLHIVNRIIAKISRKEIALLFLHPSPEKILEELVVSGRITREQAVLASQVPLADDITVEADSGGHTDNQPLVSLLPSIIALRDQIQNERPFTVPVRIGAAGGISTPDSVLAAYMMGAAYVVTGSINQACVESGASEYTRHLLAQAAMADVTMSPSADMFELGARVQVIKKGSFFPMRAQKLYDLYTSYNSIDEIPNDVRNELESKVFKRSMDEIWNETASFFSKRNPDQITKANQNPKKKMALIFRWYLGLSSRWSRDGVEDRKMDYQIWCGPSMGAFNEWVRGTYLEDYRNRHVADVAWQLLTGCAYRYRVQGLKLQSVSLPPEMDSYYPQAQA